jgi:DNA repair protein SbcD/Mre11
MRIIHTADWHIGQTLTGYTRDREHRAVFAELTGLVAERQPDGMIVAGDVFDHQNPSGEAQRLFYDTLLALSRAAPRMTIVVTAGNHDAAGRLEAPGALLEAIGVRVVGNVRRNGTTIDSARHVIPLPLPCGR